MYQKSMRDALKEARDYREPEELTEMMPEPVKGYWDKDCAARGVPDIFYSMKKGNQKKTFIQKIQKNLKKMVGVGMIPLLNQKDIYLMMTG